MNIDLSYDSSVTTLMSPQPFPDEVNSIDVSFCGLTSLEGCSQRVLGDFDCSFQMPKKLTSLVSGPKYVGGSYSCTGNAITSFTGIAEYVGGILNLESNSISSLHNIHLYVKRAKCLYLMGNPIKSHVLGVFLIKGLEGIRLAHTYSDPRLFAVEKVLTKYLPLGKAGLVKSQMELIGMGLDEYAQI